MNRIFKIIAVLSFVCAVMVGFTFQPVMAETHTKYMTAHPPTDPGAGAKGIYFQSGIVDCNNTTYFTSGVTNNDVIQIVKVPINTIVQAIYLRTTRGTSYTGTSGVMGDGNNARGFINNAYTATKGVPWIDLEKVFLGVSVWRGNHNSAEVISGVSATASSTAFTGVSNFGEYFSNGVSVYKSRDTIDMTVFVNKAAASGVTPKFEYMIECIKLPTN